MNQRKITDWLDKIARRDPALHQRILDRMPPRPAAARARGMAFESARAPAFDDFAIVMETIVEEVGRPAIPIIGGRIAYDNAFIDPQSEIIVERLSAAHDKLEPVIPLVGRIDVANFWGAADFIGTGWRIEPDVIVTNRHVAELVGARRMDRFVFRPGRFGDPMTVSVDFIREMENSDSDVVTVDEVIWIEEDPLKADIAFLRVAPRDYGERQNRIVLAEADAEPDDGVAVIGYPARSSSDVIPDQERMDRIYGKSYDIKRIAPGMMDGDSRGWATHDCTTLGGNSGSVVVDIDSGEAVALHFAGLYMIENYAVPASTIRRYIKERPWQGGSMERPAAPVSKPADSVAKPATPDALPTPQPDPGGATAAPVITVTTETEAGGTVSIPLTITVTVGGAAPAPASPVAQPDADEAALNLWREKNGEGVLTIRASYLLENGRLTDEDCIEVVAHPERLASVEATFSERSYGGFPILIVPASIEEQMTPYGEGVSVEGASSVRYNDEDREGEDFSLAPIEDDFSIICHVGPERSWSELSRFLGETRQELVSAIYQFHAGHIADLLTKELDERTRLTLVMDGKSRDPGDDDIKDGDFDRSDVFEAWEKKHHNRFERIFTPAGKQGLVASAYHIKVTVRDGNAVWLSSGNWKRHSQPNLPPGKLQDAKFVSRHGNREWHVIAHNAVLADRMRNHILADLAQSRALGGREEGPGGADVLVDVPLDDIRDESIELEASTPARLLEPLTLTKRMRVTPLLTPDKRGAVYCEAVLELIESAEEQLLFQIPYINTSISAAKKGFPKTLMDALARKAETLDDFRLLLRSSVTKSKAVGLKKRGVDMDRQVRQVRKHHTKGMIIDGKRVLLGSHNWSAQGLTLNRDASLILDDAEAAVYYREAFEIDWARARAVRVAEPVREFGARIAQGDAPPPGFRRMPIEDFLEE